MTPTPWTTNNEQYRSNVLQFLTALSGLGATPLLSIANPPYTGGDARLWWQQASKVAILLRQVYFTSPNAAGLYELGPGAASLSMRQSLRGLVNHLTQIGIPSGRIALQMQLTTSPGLGQRAGLQAQPWFEIVKLEALAASSCRSSSSRASGRRGGRPSAQHDARPGQGRRGLRLALGPRPDALRRPGCGRRGIRHLAHGGASSTSQPEPALPHERRHDLPERGGGSPR
jgi:hypothetical protein